MQTTSHTEALNRLIREFMAGLREHLQTRMDETDPEVLAERIFAAVAALTAGALLALPLSRRRDSIITALLAAAARFWARRALQ